jgi:hypothetical protein
MLEILTTLFKISFSLGIFGVLFFIIWKTCVEIFEKLGSYTGKFLVSICKKK